MAAIERTITAAETTVNIGGTVTAKATTFNGAIPSPTLRFNVNDGEEYARVEQN